MKRLSDKIVRIENKEITVTHPDKLLFTEAAITKWDFVVHVTRLAPFILPYARDRLLTVIRSPDGTGGKSFYQKNVPAHAPAWVQTAEWQGTTYVLLQNTATLVWLATQAALELHTSFHFAHSEAPAELVFDLDPTVEGFAAVVEVSLTLHNVLQSLGLTAVPKTSGATGLQVYVPIARRYSFAETRLVGAFIAKYLHEKLPRLVTLERLKRNRGDKVYIDYLQHWLGKTLITPYSPRARNVATVSTPVLWQELARGVQPEDFTLHTIHARLEKIGDIFSPLQHVEQRLALDDILTFIRKKVSLS